MMLCSNPWNVCWEDVILAPPNSHGTCIWFEHLIRADCIVCMPFQSLLHWKYWFQLKMRWYQEKCYPSLNFTSAKSCLPNSYDAIAYILSDLMVVWRARPMKTALPTYSRCQEDTSGAPYSILCCTQFLWLNTTTHVHIQRITSVNPASIWMIHSISELGLVYLGDTNSVWVVYLFIFQFTSRAISTQDFDGRIFQRARCR